MGRGRQATAKGGFLLKNFLLFQRGVSKCYKIWVYLKSKVFDFLTCYAFCKHYIQPPPPTPHPPSTLGQNINYVSTLNIVLKHSYKTYFTTIKNILWLLDLAKMYGVSKISGLSCLELLLQKILGNFFQNSECLK